MVGSVLSFWDGPFSGAMLVLGRVTVDASKNFSSISVAGGSRNIVLFSAMISLHLYNLTSIFLMGGSTISYPPVNQLGNEISPFLIGYTIYIFKLSFFPPFSMWVLRGGFLYSTTLGISPSRCFGCLGLCFTTGNMPQVVFFLGVGEVGGETWIPSIMGPGWGIKLDANASKKKTIVKVHEVWVGNIIKNSWEMMVKMCWR